MTKKPKVLGKIELNVLAPKPRKKKVMPEGKKFEKGNKYAYKPGQSGNPSGRPRGTGQSKLSKAYDVVLGQKVPKEILALYGVEDMTWAEVIARGMASKAATGDTPAAKEIREVTEGRLPESVNMTGSIDYTAGQGAKELLLGKIVGSQLQKDK